MDFKAFYFKYKDLVYNVALNYSANIEDAQEITQDVFLTLLKKIDHFRSESKMETWIYKITINKSLDYLRFKKRKKRKFLFNNLSIERASNNDLINFNHPGVQLESKEKINEIYKCINKLPNSYKTVIILLKIENRTYKEVSSIMGLSVKAIESLFNRAKNTLEIFLKKENEY